MHMHILLVASGCFFITPLPHHSPKRLAKRWPLIGTVPYFVDGDVHMTESSGICHYLVEKYQRYDFGLKPDHPEYGSYVNWLFHSDATLTFPQTIVMRYLHLEPSPEKLPVAVDYAKWFYARLRLLDQHILEREYLVDNRFTRFGMGGLGQQPIRLGT